MEIGKKIRKVRELRDLTQAYMAAQLGLCPTAYANIEIEKSDPKWSRFCCIAELLNVTPIQLIAFDPERPFASLKETKDSLMTVITGEATSVADKERELYEDQIKILKQQLEFLRDMHRQTGQVELTPFPEKITIVLNTIEN